jgi:GGDEF domain-containing protein
VLLPGCSAEEAERVAEAVALRVRARTEGAGRVLTLSAGIATMPDVTATGDGLHGAADAALYRAKSLGRDRIASAAPQPPAATALAAH